jgi:hypothetical protein
MGNVPPYYAEHVSEVNRPARLHDADNEEVGEAAGLQTMQCTSPILPMLAEGQTVTTGDDGAHFLAVVSGEFEARRVDDSIKLNLFAFGNDAFRRDSFDTSAVGVNQRHIWTIEGLEILVVEAGSFAELIVPGLEVFRCLGVFDDRVHSRANLRHLHEVCNLQGVFAVLLRCRVTCILLGCITCSRIDDVEQRCKDIGPATAH